MNFHYYLFRDSIKSIDNALTASKLSLAGFKSRALRPNVGVVAAGDEIRAYYRPPQDPIIPQWSDFVTGNFEVDQAEIATLSSAFIVFVKTSGRVFCIPFGQGHHELSQAALELNFGQEVTLNKSIPTELHRVQKHLPGRRSKTTDVTRFYSAPVLDIVGAFSTELLKGIEGKIQHKGKLRSLGGLDSLSWMSVDTVGELIANCKLLLSWFKDASSRPKEFKVFENFKLVRDDKKKGELDDRLFAYLKSGKPDNFAVVPPSFKVDEQGVSYKAFTPWGKSTMEELTALMVTYFAGKANSQDEFNKVRVEAFNAGNLRVADRPIRDFLSYTDEAEPDWIYCLHDRDWYRLTSDFAVRLNEAVDQKWNFGAGLLPDYSRGMVESAYNAGIPKETGFSNHICLDKGLIQMGTNGTGTEPCDIISPNMDFIAVKQGTSFDKVSYVCAQALVSAQAFRESKSFRNALKKQVRKPQLIDDAYRNSKCQFVIALAASPSRNLPRDMSFNCKLTLENTFRDIENLGFKAGIFHIPYK